MTQQERKQYEWYMKKYQNADMTRDPDRERERISMIIAALFPHCSHMPPERTEKKQGRKKGLQGETPGESRDDIKARAAAQKLEQQQQRAKARQRALEHAAPSNVHHMSTRQKAQTTGSSQRDHHLHHHHLRALVLAHHHPHLVNQRMVNKKNRKAPEEQPNVPPEESESSQPEQQSAVEPSFSLNYLGGCQRKTPRSEAYALSGSGSATLSKETQEALEMPPPENSIFKAAGIAS